VFVVVFSAAVGTGFFMWFSRAVSQKPMRDYILSHLWLLHPNAICYWRTAMAAMGSFLYFFTPYREPAIFIFTFSAILDGVDGVVARSCDLGTLRGEWLDPMCDKLTYLPPLIGFAHAGFLSVEKMWVLVGIEFVGQFLVRKVLDWIRFSGAANNFGKIKAILCFGLVILCAVTDRRPDLVNIADGVLTACIILSSASVVFKFIPNRLYADILSGMNFCCGVTSLVLTYNHRFAWAICIIIIGQLFDLFDGRMALKHGGTKYGPLLDDVADFVSFGLAPAYVIVQKGGAPAWAVAVAYIAGVAFRLIRFVTVDKCRTDLPDGVFNGLPSPAGALVVLGAALVFPPPLLWAMTGLSVFLMVSHIRFAHFGRVILKRVPRPLFFLISAGVIILLSFIFKTRNTQMFGYLILGSVAVYMVVGRYCLTPPGPGRPSRP
jgi:CDP-diacylglycerol--serine O-phosphatidyltransferase